MYITELNLENIRCFEEFNLKFDCDSKQMPWTLLLGDNSTGKTTLLKSMALGLCDESSAAGLLRESDQGYVRYEPGIKEGRIKIQLKEDINSNEIYTIETIIEKVQVKRGAVVKNFYEKVKQETSPSYLEFPWSKIFACAYGAGRGTSGAGDISGYSVINAVYNLFNYTEGLQNPELTLLRLSNNMNTNELINILQRILLDEGSSPIKDMIDFKKSGITINGPWGKNIPLRDLADGYKSTFIWITDFLGWALSNSSNISNLQNIKGIIFVDEIEQHLHPKWQKKIVKDLKEAFPRIQFIVSTHSPLVVSSLEYLGYSKKKDNIVSLQLEAKNRVVKKNVSSLSGLDIDQILGSNAFDYVTVSESNPEVEKILKYASELASKGNDRTVYENKKYIEIKELFNEIFRPAGRTELERELKDDERLRIQIEIEELEKKLFNK